MNLFDWLWVIVGAAMAAVTLLAFRTVGFDRDRATWPLLLIFVALAYVFLAAGGGAELAMLMEAGLALPFVILAVVGYRGSTWWLVAGYALHAVLDLGHDAILDHRGVPAFYPGLCLGYDLTLAAWLARPR